MKSKYRLGIFDDRRRKLCSKVYNGERIDEEVSSRAYSEIYDVSESVGFDLYILNSFTKPQYKVLPFITTKYLGSVLNWNGWML